LFAKELADILKQYFKKREMVEGGGFEPPKLSWQI